VELNLEPLVEAALNRPELETVSVQVLNETATLGLIGALCSTERATSVTYDVPLRDSGPVRNSTGSYPWRLDGDYSSTVTITNVGNSSAKFAVTIKYEDGKYLLNPQELEVGETAAFDLRKIRDEQIPDRDGNVIPKTVSGGQLRWSVIGGGGNSRLIGRNQVVSISRNVSSSYSCPMCCPDSFYHLAIAPGGGTWPVGGSSRSSLINSI